MIRFYFGWALVSKNHIDDFAQKLYTKEIAALRARNTELEAENKRLREALTDNWCYEKSELAALLESSDDK